MAEVWNNPASFLVSGLTTSGAGSSIDTRRCANYAYVTYASPAASARLELQASYDRTAWMIAAVYTATTTTGTAQIAAYYPYVRATVTDRWGASTAYLHYAPGLV